MVVRLDFKMVSNYTLSPTDTLWFQRYKQIESKKTEKDMQNAAKRKRLTKKKRKRRVTTLIIRQKRIKQKNVTKAKEGPIQGSIYQENIRIINICT